MLRQKTFGLIRLISQEQNKGLCLLKRCVTTVPKIDQELHVSNDELNNKNKPQFNKSDSSTESEFLVKLKNDPDIFGAPVEETYDEGDIKENKFAEEQVSYSQKLSIKEYSDLIKAFINKRRIREAIDVLEVKMIKEDRVKPNNYIYNLLLGACGKVGYTKKAFSLYNNMKQRNLPVTGGTYTALFNACANSPFPDDALLKARHLQTIMIEKMYEPNLSNYNSMIKAFGRCGDLATAFQIADEMFSKGFFIKDDTMNFLLQACITEKDVGFRHALLVWRKIICHKIEPSVYTYNLLLRTVRECGLGDLEILEDVLKKIVPREKIVLFKESEQLKLSSNEKQDTSNNIDSDKMIEKSNEKDLTLPMARGPNLLAAEPYLGNLISLTEVHKPEDRLILLGGLNGFLENMAENKCSPDVKTFTLLLDNIPSTLAYEKELLLAMKKANVKPDIDFYNMLIKKRSLRFDYESAKDVVNLMEKSDFRPNLLTYGLLALGCNTKEEALLLLDEMNSKSYRINIEILGAMMSQACHHTSFPYVIELMDICLNKGISANQKFLEHLNVFRKKCKKFSNDRENQLSRSRSFQRGYREFKLKYEEFLQKVDIDKSEEAHPWDQFKQPTDTDVRHYKENKSSQFKPVHRSKFRVKTSPKWGNSAKR